MSENPKKSLPDDDQPSNLVKDPDDWVTGEEPMTGAQASYLKTLTEEAGEPFDDALTKADASKRIDELQAQTGRGQPASNRGHGGGAHGGGAHAAPHATSHGRPQARRGAHNRPAAAAGKGDRKTRGSH